MLILTLPLTLKLTPTAANRCMLIAAGIGQQAGLHGFSSPQLRPVVPMWQPGLDMVHAELATVQGVIVSSWHRISPVHIEAFFSVPPLCQNATLYVPTLNMSNVIIHENGSVLYSTRNGLDSNHQQRLNTVRVARVGSGGAIVLTVAPGNYSFDVRASYMNHMSMAMLICHMPHNTDHTDHHMTT